MKPWETVVEVGSSPDVQIELSNLGIGAKDSSNHLVAGFPRSFPQDSWSWETNPRAKSRFSYNGGVGFLECARGKAVRWVV